MRHFSTAGLASTQDHIDARVHRIGSGGQESIKAAACRQQASCCSVLRVALLTCNVWTGTDPHLPAGFNKPSCLHAYDCTPVGIGARAPG